MSAWLLPGVYLLNLAVVPLLLLGVIRKVKALMQNRIGSPALQPFYDTAKLLRKGETVSKNTSWVFAATPLLALAVALTLGVLVPWTGVTVPGDVRWADLLVVVYLLALSKFFTMLAAMDAGSAFGGLGASREATLTVLAEPIVVVALGALALEAGTTDLSAIYLGTFSPLVAMLAGSALAVAALTELSRMPVDDPTTHLELTMVHEALILENSGRNLALTEIAAALRACLFLGLVAQTLLRIWPGYGELTLPLRYAGGLVGLFAAGVLLAVAEGVLVKLNWRRVPNFVGFGLALSLLAALIATARG